MPCVPVLETYYNSWSPPFSQPCPGDRHCESKQEKDVPLTSNEAKAPSSLRRELYRWSRRMS